MTKAELDIQKEIEKYFTESTGFGKDKIRNFMDIVNKALKQKGERIAELENKIADIKANCDLAIEGRDIKIKELELELTVEKDQHQEEINLHLHAEDYIKSLEKENEELKGLKDVATLIRANNDTVTTLMQLNNMLVSKSQQLTKAKEHIRTLISCLIDWVQEGDKDYCYIADAEQFLKEIEK